MDNLSISYTGLIVMGGGLLFSSALSAESLELDPTLFNKTQINLYNAVSSACSNEISSSSSLCSRYFEIFENEININSAEGLAIFQTISPEQIIQQGTQATRVTAGQVGLVDTTIKTRISNLHAGLNGGNTQLAGLQFYQNGRPAGGAAGDDFGLGGKLGVWLNMNIQVGDVDNSFDQVGFNFDNYGFTGGADYKLTDELVVGAAFSYLSSNSEFGRNQGNTTTDTYTGSIYGTYYFWDNFHLDAIASYGGSDYETTRKITYLSVNTQANAAPGGNQQSYSLGIGYDFAFGALTATPYFRGNYLGVAVDSYRETGGQGWGMAFSDQTIDSWTTTLGAESSYAFSLPFGVVLAQVRAEWHHQYKDGSRNIGASFIDDPSGQRFNVVTQSGDRNFATLGTGLSGQFADGLSGFVSYDVMLGYQDISSHSINLGARMEF
ncbi:MAG: autotransporter outer membrane beta-barrel domain-containing protein [Methylicorpusculum sp.]|uniref:autotransporter outer membrane beta-barrel domain-containing protein n=1 Tax=Methylicorpusculum sp. TaxID=2713644 RepID=UPI00271B6BA3|nr:autotransporter outer membrane beta-barrel domain-containing protein [Methylicorpusculum sp.]MDO8843638.1 autotransporter outer membrane beta-barrel domain-containing protein [Methylicorpusculum sp.]MDP2203014.1 autotransporter outer membrane beta-barrel domain-containing protein [Methylicorpusculum sp.]